MRTAYSVLDFLADIGGIMGTMSLFIQMMIKIFHYKGPQQSLMDKLYGR